MMRAYELMIIIDGSLDDVVAQQWIANVSKGIADAGGNVHGKVDFWGKRRLAYPINKKEEGYYAILNVVAPGGALDELERSMRIADDVLDNLFSTCMDITFKEVDDHFKTYSDLTMAQGQIRLRPGIFKNIEAFVQGARDELRLGSDPNLSTFPGSSQ